MNETKLQAPSGWKLVPERITSEMQNAYFGVIDKNMQRVMIDPVFGRHSSSREAYTAMLAAAPAAPAIWSSATAPGPDGQQHCIAVPGMPSAARDAALEEAAVLCDQRISVDAKTDYIAGADGEARHLAAVFRGLKSIAGPVADVGAIQEQANAWLAVYEVLTEVAPGWQAKCRRGMDSAVEAIRALATSAPVQQAAPNGADKVRRDRTVFILSQCIHNMVVANQAAWIEWQQGKGAEAAMVWIHNGLAGPGHIPKASGMDAQTYFDANVDERMDPPTPAAAPAQPVGLSEQDRLDAARYRWLCKQFGQTQLPCLIERVEPDYGYVADGKESIDKAIDKAILTAKEAP